MGINCYALLRGAAFAEDGEAQIAELYHGRMRLTAVATAAAALCIAALIVTACGGDSSGGEEHASRHTGRHGRGGVVRDDDAELR